MLLSLICTLICTLIFTFISTLNCTNWEIIIFTGWAIGLKDTRWSRIAKLAAHYLFGSYEKGSTASKILTVLFQITDRPYSRSGLTPELGQLIRVFWDVQIHSSLSTFIETNLFHYLKASTFTHDRPLWLMTVHFQRTKTNFYEGMNLYLLSSI